MKYLLLFLSFFCVSFFLSCEPDPIVTNSRNESNPNLIGSSFQISILNRGAYAAHFEVTTYDKNGKSMASRYSTNLLAGRRYVEVFYTNSVAYCNVKIWTVTGLVWRPRKLVVSASKINEITQFVVYGTTLHPSCSIADNFIPNVEYQNESIGSNAGFMGRGAVFGRY